MECFADSKGSDVDSTTLCIVEQEKIGSGIIFVSDLLSAKPLKQPPSSTANFCNRCTTLAKPQLSVF